MNLDSKYPIFHPNLQISFYVRLQTFRHSFLSETLATTVIGLSVAALDKELHSFVSDSQLGKLAQFGIRGEVFFPIPSLLEARPSLLGYYRLLYGFSQKEFYRAGGFSAFKALEEQNLIPKRVSNELGQLCERLCASGELLLGAITDLDLRTIRDLQLLTLGAQLRGGQNTKLGKDATQEVFGLLERLVHRDLLEENPQELVLQNAAGRKVVVKFASDPDIAVTELLESGVRPLLSIEIKGGTDVSNIHNRLGEAEKSHQKAKGHGFFELWTIIGAEVDMRRAMQESPTTSRFFHLPQLRLPESKEYQSFRDHFQSIVGVKPT